ncbi:MAG: hypothetical protein ACM3N0_05135 [Chloroflexota bacterium]
MFVANLALVSEARDHDLGDVSRVTAALQRQAIRDFAPIWGIWATVDAFPTLEDVPVGYWPMIVLDDIGVQGAAGIHLDKDGQPFALIAYGDSWSLTASHEMLEMLADPTGNRLIPGRSPKEDQGRVEFLVEVCDPPEAAEFGYTVNDILVSDFYTPHFFEPVPAASTRYSFTGAIERPREILRGGYISWHDPVSDHWWQQRWFGAEKEYLDLGVFEASVNSLRSEIDKRTPHPELTEGLAKDDPTLQAAIAVGAQTADSAGAKASQLRTQIDAIRKAAGSE